MNISKGGSRDDPARARRHERIVAASFGGFPFSPPEAGPRLGLAFSSLTWAEGFLLLGPFFRQRNMSKSNIGTALAIIGWAMLVFVFLHDLHGWSCK